MWRGFIGCTFGRIDGQPKREIRMKLLSLTAGQDTKTGQFLIHGCFDIDGKKKYFSTFAEDLECLATRRWWDDTHAQMRLSIT